MLAIFAIVLMIVSLVVYGWLLRDILTTPDPEDFR